MGGTWSANVPSGGVAGGGGMGGYAPYAHAYPEHNMALAEKRRAIMSASLAVLADWMEHPQMAADRTKQDVLDGAAMSLVEELNAKPRCITCGQEKPDEADA